MAVGSTPRSITLKIISRYASLPPTEGDQSHCSYLVSRINPHLRPSECVCECMYVYSVLNCISGSWVITDKNKDHDYWKEYEE